jgi:hypothetical protein
LRPPLCLRTGGRAGLRRPGFRREFAVASRWRRFGLDSRTPRTTSTSSALLVGLAHQRIHQRRTGFRVMPGRTAGARPGDAQRRHPHQPGQGMPIRDDHPRSAQPIGRHIVDHLSPAATPTKSRRRRRRRSRWGTQHWRPLCNSRLLTRPPSPAIMARRPRSVDVDWDWRSRDTRQDPATEGGPFWALHRAGQIANPPTLAGTAVLAHRHAPDARRSTREHPPAAANTVRNATEQNRQLLTHEERSAPLRCRRWRQVIDSVAAKAALIAGGRICCRRRRALQHRSPAWCSRLRRRRLNLGWVDYRVGLGLFARCDRGVAGIPRCSSGRNRHWHW